MRQKSWSLQVWRTVAILSISTSGLLTVFVCYVGFAFWSNLKAVAQADKICIAPTESFDSIAAAQMIGRLDMVSILLTAAGLLLGIFALVGFWVVRREALDEAATVAVDEARRAAQEYFAKQNENGTNGDDKPRVNPHNEDEGSKKPLDPASVTTVGATEETRL